jgi:hypothetical protein
MTTDNKTLADAKPGGCVQLGDWLLPCPFCGNSAEFVPYKNNGLTLKCKSMGCIQRHQRTLRYGIEWLRTSMTEHWNARALSAQPSPGGQDALSIEKQARELLAVEYERAGETWAVWAIRNSPMEQLIFQIKGALLATIAALAALQPVRIYGCCAQPEGELHTAECPNMRHLAVRQPVGEPVAFMVRWKPEGGFGLEWPKNMQYFRDRADEYEIVPLQRGDVPAQAVDLGQFRELYERWSAADPHPKATARGAMVACAMELLALLDSQAVGK